MVDKEIAYRARFTQSDIRIILDTFEDVIKDIIYNRNELKIVGLFKLYVTTIKAHKGWSPNNRNQAVMFLKQVNLCSAYLKKNKFPPFGGIISYRRR